MSSNPEIDKDNIIPVTYEHLPEDVRLVREERKKKRDEEDLLAALARSIDEARSPRLRRSTSLLAPQMHLLR